MSRHDLIVKFSLTTRFSLQHPTETHIDSISAALLVVLMCQVVTHVTPRLLQLQL